MKKSLGAKTIVFPTPVFIVGSYDMDGNPNIMNAAWGGICSSNPASVAVAVRPERHTYANIMASRAFTVSIPSIKHVREADYVGIYSGKDGNKFEATGLTPVKGDVVHAPYVAEFPLVLECTLAQTVEIGVHTQFIGTIEDVKADEDVLNENGVPDPAKIQPFTFSPSDAGYYALGEKIAQAFAIGKEL